MIEWWLAWLPTDPALRLAAHTAVGLALVTLLVLVQVLAVSAWATRERAHRERFNQTWRPQLAVASVDDRGFPTARVPRGRQRLWWLMLWNRIQRQLRGDATARLNRLLRLLAFERYALRLLHRRGVRNRLVALETLRHLADARHWDAVVPLLQVRNPFVALAAAQALVAMDPARAMQLVLPIAVARADWGVQRLLALCRQAGREAVTAPLLHALDAGEPRTLDRMVPLMAYADPRRIAPWARGCLQHDPDATHRQAALQALGELGDPRDRDGMRRALADEDPNVRLTAVQAIRRQAQAGDADVLLPLLADRSWWVRQEAADGLVALPRMDLPQLEALLARVDDRYGREALERALTERRAQEVAR